MKTLVLWAFGLHSLAFAHYAVLRVPISSQVQTKNQLIGIYQQKLQFPAYCGQSWDSFEECIHDLSWLVMDEHIIIEHHSLPTLSPRDLEIYLEIIRDAERSSKNSNHPIEIKEIN